MCLLFQDAWNQMTGAFWKWHSVTYVISPQARSDMELAGVPLDFAIKYFKNIVLEFGVNLSARKSSRPDSSPPERLFCFERKGPAYPLQEYRDSSETDTSTAGRTLISSLFKASRSFLKIRR
jgi:hypothetical protein